jgi:predicted NBD/HSP70 family sugar kinase
VTRLARELQARGFVHEGIQRAGTRGQPPRPLRLTADGAYAFGVNFSHSYIDLALINLAGEPVAIERRALDLATPERIAEIAAEALLDQLRETGIALTKVVGAGFSLPGDFLETPHFLHAHAAFPDLRDRDLVSVFRAALPVDVFVENDGTCAALGERVHGIGRTADSILFLHIGHGVGAGLMINGRPWRGARGNAGTIGVMYPMSEPRPSGHDLFETLRASGVPINDFNDLESLEPQSCPPLRRWLARAGEQLRHGIEYTARTIDPELIIVGGRLPPMTTEALLLAIDVDATFAPSRVLPHPRLVASSLGPYAGVIGAASVCFYQTFLATEDGGTT